MKLLGDQVVKICMSIVAKIRGRDNKKKPRESTFTFNCRFCGATTPLLNAFHIKGCKHFFCPPCIVKFVVSKLQDDITSIKCPHRECRTGVLDLEYCRRVLPADVTDRWERALSESNNSKYLNCPYKVCAARLTWEEIRPRLLMNNEFMCPRCNREVCIKCRVPYHRDFDCFYYQKIKVNGGGEEGLLMYLAQKKQWKRCPCCNYYVMKTEENYCVANNDVTCWCGHNFCYHCLLPIRHTHFGLHKSKCCNCKGKRQSILCSGYS